MTGLEKIIAHITTESEKETQKLISEAQKEADDILCAAEKSANEQKDVIIKNAEKEASDIIARAESLAQLNSKKAILKMKQELINETLEKALNAIYNLTDDRYFDIIVKMIEKFADGTTNGKIMFSQKDLKKLTGANKEKVSAVCKAKNLEICEKAIKIDSGFILVYEGIEENCSFKAIFDAKKDDLQDKVMSMLFN